MCVPSERINRTCFILPAMFYDLKFASKCFQIVVFFSFTPTVYSFSDKQIVFNKLGTLTLIYNNCPTQAASLDDHRCLVDGLK